MKLAFAIENLQIQETLDEVKRLVLEGMEPLDILAECRIGMESVGKRFEAGEYFLAELMFAAKIFNDLMEILGPELRVGHSGSSLGKVLIATVRHDIHDLGKNLVAALLKAAGFEVVDLGVNVPPSVICEEIENQEPDIVGLSCLLTSAIESMEEAIGEIRGRGLGDRVRIIVGGAPIWPGLAAEIGADAYGADPYEAIVQCQALLDGGSVE